MTDDEMRVKCAEEECFVPMTKGLRAIVDREDYDFVMKWRWHSAGPGYARRGMTRNGKKSSVSMHREIMLRADPDGAEGMEVDHINGNIRDNRRCNLRWATHSQNNCYKALTSDNTSGRKGVSWDKESRKWRAQIVVRKKRYYLGRFADIEMASKRYMEASREMAGEFSPAHHPALAFLKVKQST